MSDYIDDDVGCFWALTHTIKTTKECVASVLDKVIELFNNAKLGDNLFDWDMNKNESDFMKELRKGKELIGCMTEKDIICSCILMSLRNLKKITIRYPDGEIIIDNEIRPDCIKFKKISEKITLEEREQLLKDACLKHRVLQVHI